MTLPHALETYPYLVTGVLWFCGLLLVVRSRGFASHRRLILRAGLIMIPNSLFSLAHRDYWDPVRVGGWPLGPEDALFAFNVAAMGCLAVVLFSRNTSGAFWPPAFPRNAHSWLRFSWGAPA